MTGENISDEDIIDAQKVLSQKFNKNVYLLIIQNNNNNTNETYQNNFIIKIKAPTNNVVNAIFSRIKITKHKRIKIYRKCKKILIQIACGLIPGKSLRDTLRARLKRELLGDDW